MKELLRDWLLVNENRELRTVYTRISTFILYRNKNIAKKHLDLAHTQHLSISTFRQRCLMQTDLSKAPLDLS